MAEEKGPNAVTRALNAAWIRPFLFLIVIVVAWDLSIRLFRIPAYRSPRQAMSSLCCGGLAGTDAAGLADDHATICGFLLSAAFGIPMAMLIAGSKTVESYVYPLLVFSQSVPKIAIAPLFVVWFGFGIIPKVISAFLLGFFPWWSPPCRGSNRSILIWSIWRVRCRAAASRCSARSTCRMRCRRSSPV